EPLSPTGALTVQLIKTYTSGPSAIVRNIYKPVASPAVTLQRNGSPYLTFSLDTTTGLVTLVADSTATITAITKAANAQITTSAAHGFAVGQTIDSSGFSTYTSGGTAAKFVQPGESLAWSGQFDTPVRFETDELKVSFDDST